MKPVVITIAGSDSSGGAGIQADLRTISALGGWPATVITAVTAQDATGVLDAQPMDAALVRSQLRAVFAAGNVAAVKTGMLSQAHVVLEVAAALREYRPGCVVCDPVLHAGSGAALLEEGAVDSLVGEILPHASLVTPNVPEAERLTGVVVRTLDDAALAGRRLLERGAKAALVTGGHLAASPGTDVLVTAEETRTFEGEWLNAGRVHGTGCVLSAALATLLGQGESLADAVTHARAFVRHAIHAAGDDGPAGKSAEPYFARETA